MINRKIHESPIVADDDKLSRIADIIRLDPMNREAYIDLAMALTELKKFEQAIKSFQKAYTLKEDFIILYNIGCLYYKNNDFKNAILALEKSKLLNNKFHMIFLLAGLCYGRLNNYKAAESNFVSVVMNDPENTTALSALAILYYNQGKLDESLKIINRIPDKNSTSGIIHKIKTEIHSSAAQQDRSAYDIKQYKNNSEKFKNFDNYIKSVPVKILNDKYGSIEEKIKRLENTTSKTRENLISLSLCHLFSGNTDSAMDYLIEARGFIPL